MLVRQRDGVELLNFEIMSNKELVSILVRLLCDMDDYGNGLAEDSLYDFVNNPNASLSEKQNALALIERKIAYIAEDIGYFEEDIVVGSSDKDMFALYSLLVVRRYLMEQIMGEPSEEYVERVSYQSYKLSMLTAECLRQGIEMWHAIMDSSSFKENDGYLQYGEYVLTYQADSCQSVLAFEDDDMYGSDFPFIHRLIYTLGEQTNMFDNNLIDKKLVLDALADKDWAVENLPSDVTSCNESILFTPAFYDIKICPALLALHCSLPYSIPDIVRMNDFVINTSITCKKNYNEDTFCKQFKN